MAGNLLSINLGQLTRKVNIKYFFCINSGSENKQLRLLQHNLYRGFVRPSSFSAYVMSWYQLKKNCWQYQAMRIESKILFIKLSYFFLLVRLVLLSFFTFLKESSASVVKAVAIKFLLSTFYKTALNLSKNSESEIFSSLSALKTWLKKLIFRALKQLLFESWVFLVPAAGTDKFFHFFS